MKIRVLSGYLLENLLGNDRFCNICNKRLHSSRKNGLCLKHEFKQNRKVMK